MPRNESPASSRRPSAIPRLGRNKGQANVSTVSLTPSSVDGDDRIESEGLRASIDDTRATERRRQSLDKNSNIDESSGNRLTAFISRQRSKIRKNVSPDTLGLERDTSADSSTGVANQSESSLSPDESGRSSYLTDDNSDQDGRPTRPTLSPRHSHTGYLTLSSPEITVQTRPLDNATSPPTLPTTDSNTSIPRIIEPPDSPPPSLADRNPSPVDKLRSSFTLPRRKRSTGDGDSIHSGTSSSGLRGLFKSSSRRNSVDTRASDTAAAQQEEIPAVPLEQTAVVSQPETRPETPKQPAKGTGETNPPPSTPPNAADTPTTLVTPPSPTFPQTGQSPSSSPSRKDTKGIRDRRIQAPGSLSKLTASITPLTPTAEEAKTPGGTLIQPTNATGFFTSFLSTAQRASGQFGNINSSLFVNQKNKPATAAPAVPGGEEVIPGVESVPDGDGDQGTKRLAVETLGKGDLSLSHLGIADTQDTASSPQRSTQMQNDESSRKTEEEAAARAVSSAYEKPVATAAAGQANGRPASVVSNDRLTLQGDQTPPRAGTLGEVGGIKRSGSVRSKLSGRRKHRESSATAGTDRSIAAAIKDSAAGLANPGVHGSGHRLTGFAVASSKRNKDFHQLFRSVPEDDYLIEDYSAALQRDILLHGRLYVSEGHICFSSNILGWVTNLVISFDEVVSVEKKSTAVIFPNAIVISTLNARNVFASFVARDSTYELLIGIWKISHPNLKSSLNGVVLDDAGTGDKTEVADPDASDDETEDGTEDEVYDEDAEDDVGSFTDAGAASHHGSDAGDEIASRKVSAAPLAATPHANGFASKSSDLVATPAPAALATNGNDFPGAATHTPTECSDGAEHYDRPLTDTTIPAPLGKVYSMMFGPESGAFMRKWLVEDQKSRELNFVDDKTGLNNDHKSFTFDYIKPLSAPVGPKQTKCITTLNLTAFDLEKAVSVDCSTQTPDVPSGNVFVTKTRYCLMWGPSNSTRLIATSTVEWSGKSWLKGAIEKGANDGQIEYARSLVAALKLAVVPKAAAKGTAKKGKRKGKKEASDADGASVHRAASIAPEKKPSHWGLFEPLHAVLEPLLSIFRPFISSQVVIVVLLLLLAYTRFFSPAGKGVGVGLPGYSSPERIAAYEEIWRREESALWDWLEDRVGIDGVHAAPLGNRHQEQQSNLHVRSMERKLDDERMHERQVDDAIRTTEERLTALKDAVSRKKAKSKSA